MRLSLDRAWSRPGMAARAEEDFPEQVAMGEARLPLRYRFAPGEDDDGTTLEVGEAELAHLEPQRFDWLVPGRLEETVACYLEQCPRRRAAASSRSPAAPPG